MEIEIERTIQERDKCKHLYTQEVKHKMDQKVVIESQKRLIDKQAFITQVSSRPSTQGQRLDTSHSIRAPSKFNFRKETNEGLFTSIVRNM